AHERAGDENQRRDQQHEAAAENIRQASAAQGTHRGSDQHHAYDQFLLEGGESELRANENERAGNHSGVVAEEKSTEGGERGGGEYKSGLLSLNGCQVNRRPWGCLRAHRTST